MKLSSRIETVSYLKAHAAEIARTLGGRREPLIVTQNDEAKVVMQGAGQAQPAADVIARLRERRQSRLQPNS